MANYNLANCFLLSRHTRASMETPRTLIRALATNSPATPDGIPLETVEDNDLIFPACSK